MAKFLPLWLLMITDSGWIIWSMEQNEKRKKNLKWYFEWLVCHIYLIKALYFTNTLYDSLPPCVVSNRWFQFRMTDWNGDSWKGSILECYIQICDRIFFSGKIMFFEFWLFILYIYFLFNIILFFFMKILISYYETTATYD